MLCITIIGGILIALLLDQEVFGQTIVRLLVIAPFFVMPTVAALVWKNMMMNPVYGVIGQMLNAVGIGSVDWLTNLPLTSIIIIVAWQWLPFSVLILLTALQSLSQDQKEAAEMDGAGALSIFFYITLPHMKRAITVVILIQTIFLLSVYAEIAVTTGGGEASSNLPSSSPRSSRSKAMWGRRRPAVSWRSSSPTSSRFSSSASSARTWRAETWRAPSRHVARSA